METIEIPLALFWVIIGILGMLSLWGAYMDNVFEKNGQPTGPWPGIIFFFLGAGGFVFFLAGIGWGFYAGVS